MLAAMIFAAALAAEPSAHDAYCSQLSVRSTEAEMYRADPENQNAHWKELSELQMALLRHIEEEALENKMSWEDYLKLMKKRSKEMGTEIKLSEFLRARYVSSLFQRYCVPLEAGVTPAKGTPREVPNELFQPFESKGMPQFKPFNTQAPKSAK